MRYAHPSDPARERTARRPASPGSAVPAAGGRARCGARAGGGRHSPRGASPDRQCSRRVLPRRGGPPTSQAAHSASPAGRHAQHGRQGAHPGEQLGRRPRRPLPVCNRGAGLLAQALQVHHLLTAAWMWVPAEPCRALLTDGQLRSRRPGLRAAGAAPGSGHGCCRPHRPRASRRAP